MKVFSQVSFLRQFLFSVVALATIATAVPAHAQFGGPDRGPGPGWDRGPGRGGWDRDRGPGRWPGRGPDRGPQDGWGRPRPPMPPPRPPGPPMPPPRPPGPPPAQYNTVHRFVAYQDHLMTLDPNEGYRAGYRYEGPAFQTFTFPSAGVPKAPIYRCFVYGSAHFVSRDPNCEGQIQEGSLGFVAVQPSYEAGRELVRCTGPVDHLATTNIQECYNAGYRIEGVLGYVP